MTTINPCMNEINGLSALKTPFLGRVARFLEAMEQWHQRAQQRRELLRMPDHLLKDMGITRLDAYREYRKPFWRP